MRRIARPARRRRVLALAAAALALGAAGCDAQQLGAAAVVDDDRITIDDVQNEVAGFQRSLAEGAEAPVDDATLQRALLNRQIVHRLYQDAAAANGVDVTQAEIDQVLDEFRASTDDVPAALAERGLTEATAPEAVYDALVGTRLAEVLGSEEAVAAALDEAAADAGIWVNPRYGEWEWASGGVQAVSGSISEPAG